MRRRKPTTGTFLRIPLADGSFGYARLLESPYAAFYDYRSAAPDSDLDRIASSPILFRIAVRHLALEAWEVLGHRALEEPLTEPVVQFMQDRGTSAAAPSSTRQGMSEPPSPRNVWVSSGRRSGNGIPWRDACWTPSREGPMPMWSTSRSVCGDPGRPPGKHLPAPPATRGGMAHGRAPR
ncbi:Imm26 family immunity protein [Archangium violaceum]|uniref:Imm26 family immunity protein n=1 Tax=Archangium violaceum TaxID=83451 RepID=UPI0036DF607C